MSSIVKSLESKVVDHTAQLYGKRVPPSVTAAKMSVLQALSGQADKVESVVFLENFNKNICETAHAGGEMRTSGLAVILESSYQLSSADAVWLNGLYGETTAVYPMANKGANKRLSKSLVKSEDSTMVCGVYEKPGFDPVTGSSITKCFTVVNASGNRLSRKLSNKWTSSGMQIRDAYEDAATMKLKGEALDGTEKLYDNLAEYTTARNARLASEFGAIDADYAQTSNTFMRGKSGSVVYLNGAVPCASGALTHVSPLHGFVKFSPTSSRKFFPSTLMSHNYVDVVNLTPKQRDSIYSRAKWQGDTTVNGFALRMPIRNWERSALPQPKDVYRMRYSNFAHDERESAAIPTRVVLQMTPTKAHVEKTSVDYPAHIKQDLVRLQADDVAIAKLVALRHQFKILNPKIFDGTYLNIPRELAEKLI